MEQIENYLRTRITQLNEADKTFCEKRWDMSLPDNVRMLYREQSNSITLARQELESCLEALKLPRFSIDSKEGKCLTNLVNAHANNDPASTQKYMADAYKIVRGEVKKSPTD